MVFITSLILALTSAIAAIEPSCPRGFVSGYNGQTLDIIAKPDTVWSLIGDFGNLTWAGVYQVNLSDPAMNNVPPVWRTSIQLGFFINETLIIANGFDTNTMVGSETHTVAPFSTLPILNTTISAYFDSVTVSPLCAGLATRMTFNVGFCTTPGFEPAVSSLFTMAHYGQLQNAQAILGAAKYDDDSCGILTGVSGARSPANITNGTVPIAPGVFRNGTSWNGTTTISNTTTTQVPGGPSTPVSFSAVPGTGSDFSSSLASGTTTSGTTNSDSSLKSSSSLLSLNINSAVLASALTVILFAFSAIV